MMLYKFLQNNRHRIIELAWNASDMIMSFYRSDLKLENGYKADNSIVTLADKAVSDFLVKELMALNISIPAVSEEEEEAQNLHIVRSAPTYWLIDPIDGTWSFVKKRGIFTVNIALIHHGVPIYGLILSPLHQQCYHTVDQYVWVTNRFTSRKLYPKKHDAEVYHFLLSSRNTDKNMRHFLDQHQVGVISSVSSSYKFCLLIENRGDIYPRFLPTSIWDTAAGHALLNNMGGTIVDLAGNELKYQAPSLLNPYFIAYRCQTFNNCQHKHSFV